MEIELSKKTCIGERTYCQDFTDTLFIVQKIKIHSIVTTVCFGVFVYLVFKTWIVSLLLMLLSVLQIFMTIKVTIKNKDFSIRKDLYFLSFRLYTYYNLVNVNYEIVDYESGRGADSTDTSFDIGFFIDNDRSEILAFGSKKVRDRLIEILGSFFSRS